MGGGTGTGFMPDISYERMCKEAAWSDFHSKLLKGDIFLAILLFTH